MSRTIPADLLAALGKPEFKPYYAVEFNFKDNPLRLWTGYDTKTIKGKSYIGAGHLLTISGLEEASDLSAKSVTLSLSGMPSASQEDSDSALISLALQEPYQRRECKIFLGTTDTADPIEIFSGPMSTMTIEDSGESSVISVVVESRLARLEKASNRRYNDENHSARHSGDSFFSFVTDLQGKEVVWGREKL